MPRRTIISTRRAAVSACCAAIGSLVVLAGPAQAVSRSCAWQLQTTANQVNIAYPDEGAKYWTSVLPIPPGGHIEIDGQFPHARYTSLQTYNEKTQAIDGINDTLIQPDRGSSNPFLAGANRAATNRSYKARIVNERIPASGRPSHPRRVARARVPNFAYAMGYTNISWTLKVDLVCAHLCRLMDHMDACGYDTVVPELDDPTVTRELMFDGFASNYVQRSVHDWPRQGSHGPWTAHMDYAFDRERLGRGAVQDPALRLGNVESAVPVLA